MVCDNKHYILAISNRLYENHNNSFQLIENTEIRIETLKKSDLDLQSSHLNADAGFDIKDFMAK